MEHSKI